jgi:hypothetical protein
MSPIRVGRYNAPSEDEYTPPRGGRGNINRGLNTPVINMQRPGTDKNTTDTTQPGTTQNTLNLGPDFPVYADFYARIWDENQSNPELNMTPAEMDEYARLGMAGVMPKRQPNSPTGTGTVTTQTTQTNAPLMSALTQYANNMGSNTGMNSINDLYGQLLASTQSSGQSQQDSIGNLYNQLLADTRGSGQSQQDAINKFYGGAESQLGGLNADALAMLQNQYNQISGEIGTQTEAGRTTIDETTQRALEALGGQSNPYAGLQMANVGAVTDPMAAYSQAVGAPQGGILALQDMLQSQNAATGGGFNNLAQLLGASNQAAQQSRIGDVSVARAGAQQDLAANQRAAALRALQQSQQAQQAQQGTYAQQLLGLGQNRLQANLGAEQNTSNLLSQLAQSQLQSQLGSQQNTGNLLSQLQQGQLNSQLGQQQNTQGRQAELMQQLLGLAGQGVDVSQIMAILGGQ